MRANSVYIKPSIKFFTILLFSCVQFSCKKYLDEKRSQEQAVPSTLKDLQALLDNSNNFGASPCYLEFVGDNYYVTSGSWSAAQFAEDRQSYIWDREAKVYNQTWIQPYSVIYYANLVLDYLPKISTDPSEATSFNDAKGTALFYRAFMFHQLAQLFCRPFSQTANTDPGIVLKLTSAVGEPIARTTVQQTYDRIISDLKAAADLLPLKAVITTRPNKAAAYGLLARVYLSMRDYANAEIFANQSLALNNTLLDFNSLTPANQPSLPQFTANPEILFTSVELYAPALVTSANARIDTTLLASYTVNDLRKKVLFRSNGTYSYWWGSYYSNNPDFPFDGIATDEILLVRAECRARKGDKDGALSDLNLLLKNRIESSIFTNLTASSANEALALVLTERRKELVYRGLRWSDLRRLNLEGANITLKRIINGTTYTLPPNDLRWVLLIPEIEVSRSAIQQNPR